MTDHSKKHIVESQYFPTIGWFVLGRQVTQLQLEVNENYQKRTFRNKAIIGQGQKKRLISVPLKKGKHGGQPITDVMISDSENWRLNHIQTIQACYGKSPYFEHYSDLIFQCLETEEAKLFQLNESIIKSIVKEFNLEIYWDYTDDFYRENSNDIDVWRDCFQLKGGFNEKEYMMNKSFQLAASSTHLPEGLDIRNSILDLAFHLGPETRLVLDAVIREK